MIIKVISVKEPVFDILTGYILRHESSNSPNVYLHNMIGVNPTKNDITKAFITNAKHAKPRANQVFLYHDILSFHPSSSKALDNEPEILFEVMMAYTELRAKDSLACGVIHKDKKHYHIHLLVSGNKKKVS